MSSKASEAGKKKKKQKNMMEAKFIRTKPLPPSHPTHSSSQPSNQNQKKNEKKASDQNEQKDMTKEQFWAKLLATGLCFNNLGSKNHKSNDQTADFSEADWMEIRQYFNHAYHTNNEDSKQFVMRNSGKIVKVIKRLCAKDSQKLLWFLESQVQEFAIEIKVKLLQLLKKSSGQPGQLARNFFAKLVEQYAIFSSGATCLAGPLKDLDEGLLAMFGMGWEDLNRLLFERCVHSDPVIQLKIPQFVSLLQGSLNQKDKSGFYLVFKKLLILEEHMTNISEKWKRVESFTHENKVNHLCKMASQLRIDLCANKGTKKHCSCGPCASSLLRELSQLGISQQNNKVAKDKSSLEQKSTKSGAQDSKKSDNLNSKQQQAAQKNLTQVSPDKGNTAKQGPNNNCKQPQKGSKGNQKAQKVEPQTAKYKETATKSKSKQQQTAIPAPIPPETSKKNKQKNVLATKEKCNTSEVKSVKKDTVVKEKNPGDNRPLNELLDFIEGTDNPNKDEKKAAKKARQKIKKTNDKVIQQKIASGVYEPPAAVIKVPKPFVSVPTFPKTEKKEPQMVTIRRVMEPSSSEPTVTITLKGDTPARDKVLFTLVNGQVKEDSKNGKKQNQPQQNQPTESKKSKKKKNKGVSQSNPPAAPPVPQPVPMNHMPMQQERFMVSPNPYQLDPKPHVTVTPIMGPPYSTRSTQEMSVSDFCAQQPKLAPNRAPVTPAKGYQDEFSRECHDGVFSLQNIKLPPGITITKVEGPRIVRPEPPPPPPVKREEPPTEYGYPQMGTMIVNMPQPLPQSSYQPHNLNSAQMSSMRNMGMQNPNVIVVDTGKLMDEEVPNHSYANTHNGMWQQANGTLNHPHLVSGGIMLNGNGMTNGQAPPVSGGGKKKRNKKKGKKGEEWNLVESVFAPKDIDLDAVDDEERELEAFKRFCFNSVPPERKEKVHFNMKDLNIKKKP
ncbi:uncharacterized protein LOC135941146 isoform X2 [Cloeon dipterum]|uniref:uncharacterized protein LOC135941146 isoform X2 n=1 Tax=Cloeon dipterum TaxID=197152 RepID=UPI00322084BC